MKPHIYRYSESNIMQPIVEYLQGGILLRFDFIAAEREIFDGDTMIMYEYQEFWVDKKEPNIETITGKKGHVLTNDYKKELPEHGKIVTQ